MHFSSSFAAAALVAGVSAVPTRLPGFIVNQSKNHNYVRNGAGEYSKALAKYANHPKSTIASIGKINVALDNGNVTTTPDDGGTGLGIDVEYLSPVQINGKTFNLDFDTGSADLWVLGDKVKTQGGNHTVFEPSSGSSPVSNEAWKISYGDGSGASGVVYSETVNIGSVSVTKQAVEVATSASAQFASGSSDGLVGLAFSTINTITTSRKQTPQNTFFQNAIDQGIISKPILGVSLKYKAPGSYDFGFIRSNSSITYTDVDSADGFWTFTPSGAQVGGKNIDAQELTGIADTGTTLILVGDDVVKGYYDGTGATLDSQQGGYTFPCDTTLPDFSLVIGDATITVPGEYVNYTPLEEGSETCYGGIQSSADIGINIYGDIFLKAAYVVFDATEGAPKLGFAQGTTLR